MKPTRTISPRLARRLAIRKQHLAGPRPSADRDGIMEVVRDLGYLQLDPIRVVERSHVLVLWSRLGKFDLSDLDALQWQERRLFEYWAYRASIVPTEDYPIHNLLMRRYPRPRPGEPAQRERTRTWLEQNQALRRSILTRLRAEGPLPLRAFEDRAVQGWESSGWTSGRNVERMLDVLWIQGKVVVAGRSGIQKLFDLADRWLPEWTPRERLTERDVVRRATQRSLRALGVATARHIKSHYTVASRTFDRYANLAQTLSELEREGLIERVRMIEDGADWPGPWYVHAEDLPVLEELEAGRWEPRTTLLSPFDNLIIDRARSEGLFGFRFRMEIYVPKDKRQYGYYVLPILHGDRLIGLVDPVMDRKGGTLAVNAVHAEPGAPMTPTTGRSVASAIEDLAAFLGAGEIDYRGPLPVGWRKAMTQPVSGARRRTPR
jgi:uncharacterized protein YcaQ